jgi:hypothetical protein
MLDVDCVYANVHQVDLAKEHDGTTAQGTGDDTRLQGKHHDEDREDRLNAPELASLRWVLWVASDLSAW